MSYNIDWNNSLNICTFSGATNGNDIIECNNSVHGDSRLDDMRLSIWDFSQVDNFDFSVDQCIRIADQDKTVAKNNPGIKIAIIANQDIVKRLMYLYESEMIDSPFETRVFKNINEAMSWGSHPIH